ncbi:MAG: aldo/keto reductase [Segetibacter sp.]
MNIEKLTLGTVQFGLTYGINNSKGQTSREEVFRILDFAFQKGILTLDTAPSYGVSELIIGEYLSKQQCNSFNIITKFSFINGADCQSSLKESLKRLSIQSIDTVLFHSFNDYLEHKNELKELVTKSKGLSFCKIGVTVYANDEIEILVNDEMIEVVQVPFNLLDNDFLRGDSLKKLKEKGKEIHTRSPFLQGLFFMDAENINPKFEPLIEQLLELKRLSSQYNLPINKIALLYPLGKPYIDRVLFGVETLNQLMMNISNLNEKLPDELIHSIDSIKTINTKLLNPSTW